MIILALPLALQPISTSGLANPASAASPSDVAPAAIAAPTVSQPATEAGPYGDDTPRIAEPVIDRSALVALAPRPPANLIGYHWPIRNARITNAFGKGYPGGFVVDGVTAHDGLDLATWCGDRIVAAHAGIVLAVGRHHEAAVGWLGDLSPFRARLDAQHGWRSQAIAVVIDDGNGYRSVYVHLSRTVVHAGDAVTAGQLIGYEGQTGNATGCHLHYGIFSPSETDSWLLEPKVQQRSLLPEREIARIDPLLVLPPLASGGISWGWGVKATD